MLKHTKKHRIDNTVSLIFTGPLDNKETAIEAMKKYGFVITSDSIPWRDALSEHEKENLPGNILAGARDREGITQKELSNLTGIPQAHISQMENGKRPIGPVIAKKLGKALNIGYKVFL